MAVFVSLIPALALLLAQDASLIDAPAHYQLGLALGKAGDFAGAERQFRVVLKLRPHDAAAHFNLGLALIGNPSEKLDWSGALAEFRRALHEKPDYPEARRMVAECLLNTGEPGAAAGELRTLLKARPSYTQARFSLACALEGASPDEAIGELRRVVKEKPGYAEAHSMLGKLLHQMGRKPDAALELEKALRLNPDLAAAHLTLAALYQQDGDARAAIEQAQGQRLARRKTDAIQAVRLSNRGLDAAAAGDLAGALAMLRQSVDMRPGYALAHYNLGLLLADSGDPRAAARNFRTAASLGPTLAKPWYSLGRVLEMLGDNDSALGALDRAAALEPEDPRAASLARQLRVKGTKPKPPKLTTDTPQGHNAAGVERTREGDLSGAAAEFLKAVETQPDFAEARYNLAIALYQAGQRDGAELELRKALLLRPDAATHYALGLVLKDKGDAGARLEFETALKLDPSSGVARYELERMR